MLLPNLHLAYLLFYFLPLFTPNLKKPRNFNLQVKSEFERFIFNLPLAVMGLYRPLIPRPRENPIVVETSSIRFSNVDPSLFSKLYLKN